MHMTDDRKARQIAVNLNKSFFSHGDAVSRSRARKLELQIAKSDPKLEALIWDAHVGLEEYMELRTPFNPLILYLADTSAAAAFAPVAPLRVPSNTPPPLAKQMWEAAGNQALQGLQGPSPEVSYSVVNAVVESPRLASEIRTIGRISAARLPTGEINVSVVDREAQWKRLA